MANHLTTSDINACIAMHEQALETAVKDLGRSPADGYVLTIIQTIHALEDYRDAKLLRKTQAKTKAPA